MLNVFCCDRKKKKKTLLKKKKKNMKIQTIFELYTDDNKSKYSRNPMDMLKSEKKNYETLHQVNFHSC